MRTSLSLVLLTLLIGSTTQAKDREIIKVYRTYYCATGDGCNEKICGGNEKTAHGRNARLGDGCAADPRNIPYGSTIFVNGESRTMDDTFGKKQRDRDWKQHVIHIDIRIAGSTHKKVRKMGAGLIQMEVIRKNGKIVKLIQIE